MTTSYTDIVRDNQWWYSRHPLSEALDGVLSILLVVNGRPCAMTHSQPGRDGRVTRSFRFDVGSDRDAWLALRGQTVTIEVEAVGEPCGEHLERTAVGNTPPRARTEAPRPERSRHTPTIALLKIRARETPGLFSAYLFCDWSASSVPSTGADSIWFADGWVEPDGKFVWGVTENPSTRRAAEDGIRDRILCHQRALLVSALWPADLYALVLCYA